MDVRCIYFSMSMVSLNILFYGSYSISNYNMFLETVVRFLIILLCKHVSLLNKRPVHVPQYSLTPKTEWRLVSRSLKRSINHAATGHPRGRMERREKGVLTAGHTRTTFQGECPHKGYFTPSLISMFCVLSQNCQHGF